ncbi:MAG: hypothetical protein HZB43_08090 [candidate division Zixibacteria bacterium]|nr:hypothetical protein [candidate division Zixibacteria bacterium]
MILVAAALYALTMAILLILWTREVNRSSGEALPITISITHEILMRQSSAGVYGKFGRGEHWFLRRALYWDEHCLDTTYFGYEALKAIDRIRSAIRPNSGPEYRGELLEISKSQLIAFVHAHFDESLGGFRSSSKTRHASLYGTYCALSLLKATEGRRRFEPLHLSALSEYIGTHRAAMTKDFVLSCLNPGQGFCDSRYHLDEPTLADTDIAILLLRDLDVEEPVAPPLVGIIKSFLLRCPNGKLGFRNTKSESEPLSCATHFGLRSLSRSQQLQSALSCQERSDIRDFILSCRNDDGGFAARPGGASSVAYTYMSLVDLLKYLQAGSPESSREICQVNRVLDHVMNSREGSGGYVLEISTPHPPDVHATRAAMEILRHCLEVDRGAVLARTLGLEKTLQFIRDHRNEETGSFRGF